jgi:hypothetical protein
MGLLKRSAQKWGLLRWIAAAIGVALLSTSVTGAEKRAPASASAAAEAAAGGVSSVQTPLDVRGQSRSWSRMVRARGGRDAVNFVQTRKDYRVEIESSRF